MPRAEPIKFEDIGMQYLVHSGKEWRRVKVTAQMVGHKYGEFVLTRKVRDVTPRFFFLYAALCRSHCLLCIFAEATFAESASAEGQAEEEVVFCT